MSILNSLIEIQEFATLPPVAAHIMKMIDNDNLKISELAQVIETDASLTLKLLKVANSPVYAVKTKVNSIHNAILILGLNRLTTIVLGVSIFSKFLLSSQKAAAPMMEKFWWHSSCTGVVAKAIANRINIAFNESEFIGGLLHDIGKLAMVQYDTNKYKEVLKLVVDKGIRDVEAENKIFTTNHIEVGREITKLWGLPKDLISVVSYHNDPDKTPVFNELTSVVRFADILCETWDAGFSEGLYGINLLNDSSWKVLNNSYPEIKGFDIEAFTFDLETEFMKSAEFLNILRSE